MLNQYYFVGNKTKEGISKRAIFFPKNKHILFFMRKRTYAYQGVRNVRFSENLASFVFLEHPFWDSPFCLITDDLSFHIEDDYTMTPLSFNIYQYTGACL